MAILNPPAYQQGGTYSADKDRQFLITCRMYKNTADNSRARSGLLPDTAAWSAPASWTGFSFTVGPFRGIASNGFASNGGDYEVISTANETRAITTSSPTTNRIDVIGVQVFDAFYAGAVNNANVVIVEGTPSAGTPAAPVLPATFIPLYQLAVNANSTQPVVTDLRKRTGPVGSLLNVFPSQLTESGSYPGEQHLLPANGGAPERLRYWSADARWKGVETFTVDSGAVTGGGVAQFTSPVGHMTMTIPDPGYNYRLRFYGQIRMSLGTLTGIDLLVREGSASGANITPSYSVDGRAPANQVGGAGQFTMHTLAVRNATGTLTGGRTVVVTAVKWLGGAGDGWTISDASFTKTFAVVEPV
jgi:hypothetical protein